ncbi:MAG: hypothetical protein P9M14_01905 [Candidatus Alcyoniella australis]|nr:hypothetical protein [Candidatus Alcyoniella australis]
MDKQSGGPRICLVQPQAETAALLYFLLKQSGYEPLIATDSAGLECVARAAPQLVVVERGESGSFNAQAPQVLRELGLDAPLVAINTLSPYSSDRSGDEHADASLGFPTRAEALLAALDRLVGPGASPDPEVAEINLKRLRMARLLAAADTLGFEGELTFRGHNTVKGLQFTAGMVTSARSELMADKLGNQLLARGRLDESLLLQAVRRSERSNEPLGESLIALGVLQPEQLRSELQETFAQIVFSLFTWSACDLSFDRNRRERQAGLRLKIPTPRLALFGLLLGYGEQRLDDELPAADSYLVPNEFAPYSLADLALSRDQLLLCTMIDGATSLKQILGASVDPETLKKALLLALIHTRMVRVGRAPQAPTRLFVEQAQQVRPSEGNAAALSKPVDREQALAEAAQFADFASDPESDTD